MRLWLIVPFCIICWGCAGSGIPKEQYSQLKTPEETVEFAKKAVARDDPEAFYFCLTENTRKRFTLTQIKFGWALAGGFFYLFLEAKLKEQGGIIEPAPEIGRAGTAKVTLNNKDIDASFLLLNEKQKWRIEFPSPYPLPDVKKIKPKRSMPWRNDDPLHYQNLPEDWLREAEFKYGYVKTPVRKLRWRTETVQ